MEGNLKFEGEEGGNKRKKERKKKKLSTLLLLQANPEHLVVFFTPVKPP